MLQTTAPIYNESRTEEARKVLEAFRALSNEEQRIAFAVLEGMRLQKNIQRQKTDEDEF